MAQGMPVYIIFTHVFNTSMKNFILTDMHLDIHTHHKHTHTHKIGMHTLISSYLGYRIRSGCSVPASCLTGCGTTAGIKNAVDSGGVTVAG